MSTSNSIRITLKIKDENIHFTENFVKEVKVGDTLNLIYYAKLTPTTPSYCEKCGTKNNNYQIIKHGFKECTIRMPMVSNTPTLLKLSKQRFYCKHCMQTTVAETSLIKPKCSISKSSYLGILLELKSKYSVKDIAKKFNVSSSTVNQWLTSINGDFKINYNYLPENLSFDEFRSVKSVKGKMSFIYMNSENGEVLDIVPDRTLTYLKAYFFRYPLEIRKNVKSVCIDMYEPYIQLVNSCFPNAKIITDRFHIVQHINRALNSTRIQVMKENKLYYARLKRYWKLILKNNSDLNSHDFRKFVGYPHLMTEELVVNDLLRTDKEFYNTYWISQKLKQSIRVKNDKTLSSLIHNDYELISKQMKTVLKTFRKQSNYLCNAMTHKFSNGKLEGTNNLIKVIKRIAFGYRNFYNFRARILLISNTMVRLG